MKNGHFWEEISVTGVSIHTREKREEPIENQKWEAAYLRTHERTGLGQRNQKKNRRKVDRTSLIRKVGSDQTSEKKKKGVSPPKEIEKRGVRVTGRGEIGIAN